MSNIIIRYAESYKILEDENKSLRSEIIDLRTNLKINKEIIEGFFQFKGDKDKNAFYIKKLKEENDNLNNEIMKLSKEKEDIRAKVTNN